MIYFKNVSYLIKSKRILENVSFKINNREKVLIIGESGSGKTTILNLLVGNIKPTSGNIFYDDEEINNYNEDKLNIYRKEKIRFILQDDDLFSSLTVNENLLLYYHQVNIDKILKKACLSHLKYRLVETLSGGERQRISIIKSCLSNSEVLLCDEITSALDDKTAMSFINFIYELFENKTIIFISHNAEIFKDKINRLIKVKNKGIEDVLISSTNKKNSLDTKIETKPFKSLLLNLSFKNFSLFSFILFIFSIICIYLFFMSSNIFTNIANNSRLKYYDYNVYTIKNNNDLVSNDIDIFIDYTYLFDNAKTTINDNEYRYIEYIPFYKENETSLFVINKSLLDSYNLDFINNFYVEIDNVIIIDNNPLIIIENNMYSSSCIYYNYILVKNCLINKIDSHDLLYINENIEYDSRFTNNPLFDSNDNTKPYLESNSLYDYLTYSLIFDSLENIVYYFTFLILIYSIVSNVLIYLSKFIKDLKKIAILVFRGVKYSSLINAYFLNTFIYSLLSLFLLFILDFKYYFISLSISFFINYLVVNFSFIYVKKSKLNELLKEDILC